METTHVLIRVQQEQLARIHMMKATEALRAAEVCFSMAARTAVTNRIHSMRLKLEAIR